MKLLIQKETQFPEITERICVDAIRETDCIVQITKGSQHRDDDERGFIWMRSNKNEFATAFCFFDDPRLSVMRMTATKTTCYTMREIAEALLNDGSAHDAPYVVADNFVDAFEFLQKH